MSSHPATRAYVDRRTAQGLSKKEIMRCLKRYVAREVYPHPAPRGAPSYPRFSREELGGRFLGLMAYLDPKG